MKAYKSVLVSAVVYSVVIGLIYLTLTILAILVRSCQLEMDGSPLVYMIYLLYFRVDDCKLAINWNALGIEKTTGGNISGEQDAVHRTYIFTLAYLGLYAGLIFTSLYSLSGIRNSCCGRRSFVIFFVPWILVCTAIVIMDLLATTYYIMDSIATVNNEGLMKLMEITNLDQIAAFDTIAPQWRFLPPIIMFLATSKCFIFLIMDIVIITLISRAGWAASNYHSYVEDTIRQYSSNMSRANPSFEDSQNDIAAKKQQTRQDEFMSSQAQTAENVSPKPEPITTIETPVRYNDTSRDNNIQAFVYPDRSAYSRNAQKQQEEKPNSVQRPSSLALNSNLSDRQSVQQNSNHLQNGRSNARDYNGYEGNDDELEDRLSRFSTSNGNVVRTLEPLKTSESMHEKHQQQTRVRVLPMVAEINRHSSEVNRNPNEVKQRPKVPPKPQNVNRISQQPSFVDERRYDRPESRNSAAKVDRTSSMNAPEELRGQLPWSYFKPRDDVPKRAFTELKEDEELPSVPVPDYTLHFPKTKRINLSDSDGENSWSRYEPRY